MIDPVYVLRCPDSQTDEFVVMQRLDTGTAPIALVAQCSVLDTDAKGCGRCLKV